MPILGQLITSFHLRRLLNVAPKVLQRLRRTGALVPHTTINSVNHYLVSDVNAFLAASNRSFPAEPTLNMLEDGHVRFITAKDAMQIAGLTRHELYKRVKDGRLWALKIAGKLYLSQQRTTAYALMASGDSMFPMNIVQCVVGLSDVSLRALCAKMNVAIHRHPANRRFAVVAREGVLALLKEMLPAPDDWISPQVWLETRLESMRPLLTLNEATRLLGLAKYQSTVKLLKKRELHYLATVGCNEFYRISPESVEVLLEQQPLLTDEEIAWIFGVTRQAVNQWKRSHVLECAMHQHNTPALWEACLAEILRPLLSPGLSPTRWIMWRRKSPHQLVPQKAVAERFGLAQTKIEELAAAGRLHGIRGASAKGQWRFTRSEVLEAYTRLQKGEL